MSVIARARVKDNLIQFSQIPSVIEKLTYAGHFDLMFSLYNNIFITESCKDKDFAILMKENLKIISASIIEEVWQFHCNQLKLSQTSTPLQEKAAKLKEKISPRPHASPKISKRAASKSSSKLSHTESLSHLEIPVSRPISRDTSNQVIFTQSEYSYTHSFMSKQSRRRLRSPNSSSQSSQLPGSRSPKHVIFPNESEKEKKSGVYPYRKGEFLNISTK